MAQLKNTPFPGFEFEASETWEAYNARTDALLRDIEKSHRVISFPVADGCALYAVISETPLILRHIPYGDGYVVPGAHIRGLRLSDIAGK